MDLSQRAESLRKVSCAQGLYSCGVSAVKGCLSGPTSCRRGVRRLIEPKSQVVHLDWVRGWVKGCIWERPVWETVWRGGHARRHDECLNAEAPNKVSRAVSVAVGLDISLIPSHPERLIGNLDHKKVKVDIGRQSGHLDVHVFYRSAGMDCNPPLGVGKTSSRCCCGGSNHVKGEVITILSYCWPTQGDQQCHRRHQRKKTGSHWILLLIRYREFLRTHLRVRFG